MDQRHKLTISGNRGIKPLWLLSRWQAVERKGPVAAGPFTFGAPTQSTESDPRLSRALLQYLNPIIQWISGIWPEAFAPSLTQARRTTMASN